MLSRNQEESNLIELIQTEYVHDWKPINFWGSIYIAKENA